jgi:transglutaminase-like putative cysteine protease
MNNKSSCNPAAKRRVASRVGALALPLLLLLAAAQVTRADTPQWMRALVNASVPPHDEKTDAVLLFSEDILNVQGNGKIKKTERRAFKILRPGGREHGTVYAHFDSETKISGLRGWCIPAQGKDFEVKDKDVLETALFGVSNGELASDVRTKVLRIPAPDPGNIIGWEIEREDRPYILQDEWAFQRTDPVREARFTLQLPPGWEYKASFLNYPEVKSTSSGSNQWQWVITNIDAIRLEHDMPPWEAVAGQMIVSFLPSGGAGNRGFENWNDMALWEAGLVRGRRDATAEIKQKVTALTASSTTRLAKMNALAKFVQSDIRYVAIELGIGGWQPHPANDVFTHKFGDCKDKATLMSAMLKEVGVDSYYVVVNTNRGTVNAKTPAVNWFNHVILAVKLPDETTDPSLTAILQHQTVGRLLIFDPTDELTPFGYLRGPLQANYGLLVTESGGELVELPKLATSLNGVQRTAQMTLSPAGVLIGDVREIRTGDNAVAHREKLRTATKDADKIKPIESMLAHSLATFRITKATVTNGKQTDQPFEYDYSLVADNYAKPAGDLLLVRPRVVGTISSDLLETKEPRRFPVEFEGPRLESDTFEIAIPPGYVVDDLPPPIDADFGFASYHSKTEAQGNKLRYTRTYEVKEVTVQLAQVDNLKKLYRIIASDERSTAVIKPGGR